MRWGAACASALLAGCCGAAAACLGKLAGLVAAHDSPSMGLKGLAYCAMVAANAGVTHNLPPYPLYTKTIHAGRCPARLRTARVRPARRHDDPVHQGVESADVRHCHSTVHHGERCGVWGHQRDHVPGAADDAVGRGRESARAWDLPSHHGVPQERSAATQPPARQQTRLASHYGRSSHCHKCSTSKYPHVRQNLKGHTGLVRRPLVSRASVRAACISPGCPDATLGARSEVDIPAWRKQLHRRSYLLVVSYDGTDFTGYQVQRGWHNARSVQSELERALCTRLQVPASSLAMNVRTGSFQQSVCLWRRMIAHMSTCLDACCNQVPVQGRERQEGVKYKILCLFLGCAARL
jgi:hypothetical protein